VPLEQQRREDLTTMRNLLLPTTNNPGPSASVTATSSASEGVAWAPQRASGPHVYFGHDAKRGLQVSVIIQ
jgi:hypothetical protein